MADIGLKIKFSAKVEKHLNKAKLSKDIMNAIKGSKAMKKEIQRVFQMANRRIQNIENAGIISPAVIQLGDMGTWKRFSKFSVKGFAMEGDSWESLKREYAHAISFLNQPTSTVTGARELKNQVEKQLNIPDKKLFDSLYSDIMNNKSSLDRKLMSAMPYRLMMENIYSNLAQQVKNQVESDSQRIADEMEQQIQKISDEMAEKLDKESNEFMQGLIKGFKL